MSGYNVRIYEYYGGYQIRMYNQLVHFDDSVPFVKEISFDSDAKSSDVRTNEDSEHSDSSSRARTIQQLYEITRANKWEYFLTLTFDRKKLDSSNYDLLVQKVSKWLNNLRSRYAPDLKYVLVPELHKDGTHYHFHGLLSNIGNVSLVSSGVFKKGIEIYNLNNWKYGFSTVSKVQDNNKVASYITKYITKDLCCVTKYKRRYWCSKNCQRAVVKNYNMSYEDIQNIIMNNSHLLTYTSESRVSECGLEVCYIEMQKGDTNG